MSHEGQVTELDVRPYLRKKLEPFKVIMDTVAGLGPDDVFVLHATFKPTPLFGVLKVKGFAHRVEEIGPEYWIVAFARSEKARSRLAQLDVPSLSRSEQQEEVQ